MKRVWLTLKEKWPHTYSFIFSTVIIMHLLKYLDLTPYVLTFTLTVTQKSEPTPTLLLFIIVFLWQERRNCGLNKLWRTSGPEEEHFLLPIFIIKGQEEKKLQHPADKKQEYTLNRSINGLWWAPRLGLTLGPAILGTCSPHHVFAWLTKSFHALFLFWVPSFCLFTFFSNHPIHSSVRFGNLKIKKYRLRNKRSLINSW